MKRIILLLALLIAIVSSTSPAFARSHGRRCPDCKPSPEYIAQKNKERMELETSCRIANGELSYSSCIWKSASNPRLVFNFTSNNVSDNGDLYVDNGNAVLFVTVCEEVGGAPAMIAKELFCKIDGKHRHELKFSDYLKALSKMK